MKYLINFLFITFSITVFSQQFDLLSSSLFTVDGTSTLHDWTVKAEKHTGSLMVTAKKSSIKALKKGVISNISIRIPVNNLRSEKGSTMDNKMYRALKMEEFPNITYTLINAIEFDTLDNNPNSINASGNLYIAGVKKTFQNELTAIFNNGILTLTGEIQFKLSDFNMERPSAMFGQIETGDDVTVNFVSEFKVAK